MTVYYKVTDEGLILLTVHHPVNADDPAWLSVILSALGQAGQPVVFPVHPRTRQRMAEFDLSNPQPFDYAQDKSAIGNLQFLEPVGYLDMLALEEHARLILTDSGGVQKEAYWFGVPCITLREEAEWVETVEAGWNVLVGADSARIAEAICGFVPPAERPALFGDGWAAERIVDLITDVAL